MYGWTLSKLAAGGQRRMRGAGAEGVREALRYGQALAAWNCAFEGARGGMYAVDRTAFDRQIIGLLEGQPSLPVAEVTPTFGSAVACPACPPDRPGSGPTLSLGARGAQKNSPPLDSDCAAAQSTSNHLAMWSGVG